MVRVVVVGGGVVGTMHARAAVRRGHDVVQVEADPEPRKASVRNFGLVWVSGRAAGAELECALRARDLWERIGTDVPGVGFRADGSLTVARTTDELDAMAQAFGGMPDAADRGFKLLDPIETRRLNPVVRGAEVVGALFCERDAIVEPGQVLPALREHLTATGRYRFVAGRTAVEVDTGTVVDHVGDRYDGDIVVVCPGAAHAGVVGGALANAPLRRCRLQMMQTEPLGERLTTAVADGDSLRFYPAFADWRDPLGSAAPVVERWHAQLLISQRASGALTIGDTHVYDEPYDFAVDEEPYDHLRARAQAILGPRLPPVRRRWAGVYSVATDPDLVCVRTEVMDGVVVVTGLGGRGMTLSPAVGEETIAGLGL